VDSEWEARKVSSKTAIMTRDMQFAVNVKRRMSLPNSVIYKHLDGATAPVISLSMGDLSVQSRRPTSRIAKLQGKRMSAYHGPRIVRETSFSFQFLPPPPLRPPRFSSCRIIVRLLVQMLAVFAIGTSWSCRVSVVGVCL
jgi:hypothetical protein